MSTPPTSESLLKQLREHFGFSQDELAQLLGLTRGMVSMAEIGKRPLPTAAWVLLLPLVEALQAAAAEAAPGPSHALAPDEYAALWLRRQRCEDQAEALRRSLARLWTQAEQLRRREQALAVWQAVQPAPAERVRRWLAVQRAEAQQQYARNGPAAQALLAGRIAALEAEAAELARWLATGPPGASTDR